MKKCFTVLIVSLAFVLMFSSLPASAASPRHGAIVTQTDEAKWSGISADIVLPKTATIKNGYADWYLGLGSAVVESGISKTSSGYKVFLGSGSQGGSKYWNSEYDTSIKDGARVNLKLINNGDGTVSLYVNGKLRYKQPVYNPSRLKKTLMLSKWYMAYRIMEQTAIHKQAFRMYNFAQIHQEVSIKIGMGQSNHRFYVKI